jgi:hypothetical protein
VAEFGVVAPDGFPGGTVWFDYGVVGDDVDCGGLGRVMLVHTVFFLGLVRGLGL